MYATVRDAIREWVQVVGAERPDQEYLFSNYDTIELNPFYTGPRGPHPDEVID